MNMKILDKKLRLNILRLFTYSKLKESCAKSEAIVDMTIS